MTQERTLSDDERDAVRVLSNAFDVFRAVSPVMPLQLAFTFLLVAHDEGLSVNEYAQKAGVPQSVMSRHLLDLGDLNRRREAGLQLIVQKIDIQDRRRTQIMLSAKGRAVASQIYRTLAGSKGVTRKVS